MAITDYIGQPAFPQSSDYKPASLWTWKEETTDSNGPENYMQGFPGTIDLEADRGPADPPHPLIQERVSEEVTATMIDLVQSDADVDRVVLGYKVAQALQPELSKYPDKKYEEQDLLKMGTKNGVTFYLSPFPYLFNVFYHTEEDTKLNAEHSLKPIFELTNEEILEYELSQ